MWIRNRSRPSSYPWSTPVSMHVHEEYCLFKTTLCFLKFKKSVMISKSFPEMPFGFSLYKCHTLSNAFEMSKNIPHSSRSSLKDLWILWVMSRSYLILESPGLKTDWLGDISLFSVKYSYILLYFSSNRKLPFLCAGNTLAFFHSVGNFPFFHDLKINSKYLPIEASQIFILISRQWTLFGSRF